MRCTDPLNTPPEIILSPLREQRMISQLEVRHLLLPCPRGAGQPHPLHLHTDPCRVHPGRATNRLSSNHSVSVVGLQ